MLTCVSWLLPDKVNLIATPKPYKAKSARESKCNRRKTDLDGHDGNASNERANGQIYHRVSGTVSRHDTIDHVQREDGDKGDVSQKSCGMVNFGQKAQKTPKTNPVEQHSSKFHRQSRPPYLKEHARQ